MVALLSVFSLQDVINRLAPSRTKMTVAALRKSVLLGLTLSGARNGVLRRSVALKPSRRYLKLQEFRQPHRRGELLVAAMMNAFLQGGADRLRRAEEGATAADHLLTMSIRALDYCPPTDIEFRDFLSALLTADSQLRPDQDIEGKLYEDICMEL